VASREKLIASIRENAKNVRYTDACKVAEWLGFIAKGQKGDHNAYARPGEPKLLNFQNRKGDQTLSGQAAAEDDRETLETERTLRRELEVTDAQRYPAQVFYSDEDEGFIALAPDLPGCSAFGDTQEEAIGELRNAIVAWQMAAAKAGNPIPEPTRHQLDELFS
jgi:predicted RNase H-like HicB family nuclease